ncbi:MAG TPA: STAS domain-containing protein [Actinomycetota bacterium]|nr:STAS domain-containing protein [Actinomycetota bacterium]
MSQEGMGVEQTTGMDVRRAGERTSIIDVKGDVTSASEGPLMDAFQKATDNGERRVVLNFNDLEYMNSGGIGLLVTMLVRAKRQGQQICAFGLNEHYRQIFELTRLDDAISIFDSEEDSLSGGS